MQTTKTLAENIYLRIFGEFHAYVGIHDYNRVREVIVPEIVKLIDQHCEERTNKNDKKRT